MLATVLPLWVFRLRSTPGTDRMAFRTSMFFLFRASVAGVQPVSVQVALIF